MKKTIIISITAIICTLLICFTLIECAEMNRYVSFDGFEKGSILDHQTGKIYTINTSIQKIIETDFINNTVNYIVYSETGSVPISNVIETKEQYLEKVENGTNTRSDDRRAELNGWVD